MIIPSGSNFRNPPKVLIRKQVVIFNAIRYSLDICDIAFDRLKINLHEFSYPKNMEQPSFPYLFSDVWLIVHNMYIFKNICKTHFGIKENDTLFKNLKELKYFRDTFQHIDHRISQILTENDQPIFGKLSWYSPNELNPNEGKINALFSGSFTNKDEIKLNCVNPLSKGHINDIEFTIITRTNSDCFEEKSILINKLIEDAKNIIENFEIQINEQLKIEIPIERHKGDIVFSLYIESLAKENKSKGLGREIDSSCRMI